MKYPAEQVQRPGGGGPFVSDNGNPILHAHVGPIADPAALERKLLDIPGVVGTGLFLGMADVVIIEHAGGVVKVLERRNISP